MQGSLETHKYVGVCIYILTAKITLPHISIKTLKESNQGKLNLNNISLKFPLAASTITRTANR